METRESVIDLLDNIAARLELTGENPFKIRAYHNASRAIAALEGDLKEQTLSGGLKNVKGIGQSIFETIRELIDTGRSSLLEELKKEIPESLMEMLEIPGLGPKKVKVIYEKLGISTLGELEYACLENRLLTLE
ncbi:MAG TPA: helix-hairpin-helix domain-containing protein, partial [Nitrospiria bacterium]|nr:helix-hairpin-helix domain-containing protein [Nitrospiria bacterium]